VKPYIPNGIYLIGSKPTFKHSYTRERVSIFGGLSEEEFSSQLTEERCNAQTYLQYIKSLQRKYGKILIVVDGVKYHFEKEHVQKFYEENKDTVRVIQLPPYSPQLNPIEQVWKKMKKWLATKPWSTKAELIEQLCLAMNNPLFMVKIYDYLIR